MGKMTIFIILITVTISVFYMMGVIPENNAPTIIDLILNPESILAAGFWTQALVVLQLGAAVGVVLIGIFTKNIELAAVGPFAIFLAGLLFEATSIYTAVADVSKPIATLLFGTVFILLAITIVDWWRGRD